MQITVHHPEVSEKVLLIRTALAGVGPDCRARLFCNNDPK